MIDEITGMRTYFLRDTLTGHTFKILATEEEIQRMLKSNPDFEHFDDPDVDYTSIYLETFD
jgi:hypothetical protein